MSGSGLGLPDDTDAAREAWGVAVMACRACQKRRQEERPDGLCGDHYRALTKIQRDEQAAKAPPGPPGYFHGGNVTNTEHVLEASGHWTNDGSDTASVWCTHPRCAFWTQQGGYNEDCWPGYDWDDSKPLADIVAEAQAAHDAWLAERPPLAAAVLGLPEDNERTAET